LRARRAESSASVFVDVDDRWTRAHAVRETMDYFRAVLKKNEISLR
jgi:hypothetical protein